MLARITDDSSFFLSLAVFSVMNKSYLQSEESTCTLLEQQQFGFSDLIFLFVKREQKGCGVIGLLSLCF